MELKKSFFFCIIVGLISSCSYINPGLQVFWGNYNMDQGNFQKANVAYLNALDWSNNDLLINYNLGNSYYSLGESESALIRWNMIDVDDRDFQFRLTFNRGIYFYEKGLYYDAAQSFKKAVLLDPSDLDAKINLELSFNRVNSGYERLPDEGDNEKDETLLDDTDRLLKYLQRREKFTWESPEEKPRARGNDW